MVTLILNLKFLTTKLNDYLSIMIAHGHVCLLAYNSKKVVICSVASPATARNRRHLEVESSLWQSPGWSPHLIRPILQELILSRGAFPFVWSILYVVPLLAVFGEFPDVVYMCIQMYMYTTSGNSPTLLVNILLYYLSLSRPS